nr:antibiotic biosynthesis protein AlbG [Bacillus atrophaeus]
MRSYLLQLLQNGQTAKKAVVLLLAGAGIWWMLSFTMSELLFLIILAVIQQTGSLVYKRITYRSPASLDL